MSSRLGRTRFRVWTSAKFVGPLGQKRGVFTLTLSERLDDAFVVREVYADLDLDRMRTLREDLISQCRRKHEEETGERYVRDVEAKVQFIKTKKKTKKKDVSSSQRGLF